MRPLCPYTIYRKYTTLNYDWEWEEEYDMVTISHQSSSHPLRIPLQISLLRKSRTEYWWRTIEPPYFHWWYCTNLKSVGESKQMLEELERAAENVGLSMNLNKTQFMTSLVTWENIQIHNTEIHEYKYSWYQLRICIETRLTKDLV